MFRLIFLTIILTLGGSAHAGTGLFDFRPEPSLGINVSSHTGPGLWLGIFPWGASWGGPYFGGELGVGGSMVSVGIGRYSGNGYGYTSGKVKLTYLETNDTVWAADKNSSYTGAEVQFGGQLLNAQIGFFRKTDTGPGDNLVRFGVGIGY